MNSTIFDLDFSAPTCIHQDLPNDRHRYELTISTLPAFAIEYFTFQFGVLSSFPDGNDSIYNDKLTIHTESELTGLDSKLVIHYHGIRDYKLLFPFIVDASLQERLGNFYREAETSFENSAWLSFMLMCGAIFEGMLFAKLGQPNGSKFHQLITNARQSSLIDTGTESIMNKVRGYRNLVYANRHNDPYVSRIDVMDTRTTLDKLIKKF
ncbi:MAG: DUF4145 domain-containing protein [Pseudanabaena frigida]|uniref:DUF4145 domain-containing protein n=1 Tax=Pseudanabaena frigida TaxID=945775 RepID=A0A2W4XNV9_9CYAN|nr:MAG: DUF4145 domain-containing protein [Pseudanabaena frigida]